MPDGAVTQRLDSAGATARLLLDMPLFPASGVVPVRGLTYSSLEDGFRMAHALVLALAALLVGTAVPGGPLSPPGAVLLGIVLAADLYLHAGVRAHDRLAWVILSVFGAYIAQTGLMLATVIIGLALSSAAVWIVSAATMLAGGVGAAIIAVVYLRVLPSEQHDLGLEVACCAIGGALAAALSDLWALETLRDLPRLALWNGTVAGLLALVSHLRIAAVRRRAKGTRTGLGRRGCRPLPVARGGRWRAGVDAAACRSGRRRGDQAPS